VKCCLQIFRLSREKQEEVIGRTHGEESKKIRPKAKTSHVGRTDLKEDGKDIKVVRQSLPYGDMKDHGLFFIAYASNPIKHEKQLNSMVGMADDIYDRIMDFSEPITGNYWFIPSLLVLGKLFKYSN
jgi:putative iron-dependent peroxidase